MEPEQREPSLLKKTRDDVLAALRVLVSEASKLPPEARAPVLREAAVAVAAIDEAVARSRAAFLEVEAKRLR